MQARRSAFLWIALAWSLIGLAVLGAPLATAQDARAVAMAVEKTDGYGRMVLTWADGNETAPKVETRIRGPVLTLVFDQPVTFPIGKLKNGLPGYVAVARMSDDRREARIALAREYRLHVSDSIDRIAIDLVKDSFPGDPDDVVSPLKAVREAAAAEAARLAKAAAIAARPPPMEVSVLASKGPGWSNIAIYWPEEVAHNASRQPDGTLALSFARQGETDLARLRIEEPEGLAAIDATNRDGRFIVTVTPEQGYYVRETSDGALVNVRLIPGSDPGPSNEPDLPPELAVLAAKMDAADSLIEPPSVKPGFLEPEALDKPTVTLAASTVTLPTIDGARHSLVDPLPEGEEDADAEPVLPARLFAGGLAKDQAIPFSLDAAPGGSRLIVSFQAPVPAAVFYRNSRLWFGFPNDGGFSLSGLNPDRAARIQVFKSDAGSVLALEATEDQMVSVAHDGRGVWTFDIVTSGSLPSTPVRPERVAGRGGSQIVTLVPGLGTVFPVEDPDTGERLYIAAAFSPPASVATALTFVEASFPATAHGLAVVPRADGLTVVQRGDTVEVGSGDGLALSNWGLTDPLEPQTSLSPAFLDLKRWKSVSRDDFNTAYSARSRAASIADPAEWSGRSALMDLARFQLAWGLASEAIGPLNLAAENDPMLRQDAKWLALNGAASVMLGRYETAVKLYNSSALRTDPGAAAWIGLALAELGDWRRARQAFLVADPLIGAHTPEWAGRFHAAAARANLRQGDAGRAASCGRCLARRR